MSITAEDLMVTQFGHTAHLCVRIELPNHADISNAVAAAKESVQDWRYGRDVEVDLEVEIRPLLARAHEKQSCNAVFMYVKIPDGGIDKIENAVLELANIVMAEVHTR